MERRIVVTGMGVVARDAAGIPAFAEWVMAGGGLPSLPAHFDTAPFRANNAYAVDPAPLLEETRVALLRQGAAGLSGADLDCALFGLLAAAEALEMAGLGPDQRGACGIALATTSGGMMDAFSDADLSGGDIAVFAETAAPSAAAEVMARAFGLHGPFAGFSCACASSPAAMSYALSRLRQGDAPMMLVGGSDRMRAADFAGFNALRAMDRDSCRPFDQSRKGMVIGDGAAILLLEDEDHALARGARPLARVLDSGIALDAHHLTHPNPDGLARAMQQALARAGLTPSDIAYVNCHGTGTPVNDKVEVEALASVFDDARPLISSTKGATGHLLGSAGAIEAIITILALQMRQAPAMATTATPEAHDFPMPGKDAPRPFSGTYAMSNSLGFGGINSSLIFQAITDNPMLEAAE